MKRALTVLLLASLTLAQDDDPIDRARAMLGTDRHAEGVKELNRIRAQHEAAAKEHPEKADHAFTIGLVHFYLENDAEALAHLKRAAQLDPKRAHYRFMIGVVLQYSDPDEAVPWMREAIKLDAGNARYHYGLGRLLVHLRREKEAATSFRSAIRAKPGYADAHYSLGILLTADDPNAALEHFEKTIKAAPRHVDAQYNAAQLHYNARRFEKALALWKTVDGIAEGSFGVTKKIVQALYALERYDAAVPFRKKLFELRSEAENPKLKSLKEFCFDQFDAGEYRVYAYETFDKKGDLYYHYTFKVLNKAGKIVRTVNLESSAVIREFGVPYLLGMNEGLVHSQLGYQWKELPTYDKLKPIVVKEVTKKR